MEANSLVCERAPWSAVTLQVTDESSLETCGRITGQRNGMFASRCRETCPIVVTKETYFEVQAPHGCSDE